MIEAETIRLLLVEDDEDDFIILRDLLAEIPGRRFKLDWVRTFSEGLSTMTRNQHEVCLADYNLGARNGIELIREALDGGCQAPIILLTAKAQEAEKVMGLELGADDYVTKPFSPRELRARIKAILRRVAEPEFEIVQFGDIEVNFPRCEVLRGGKPVELSALEFKLLAAFIESRGRVLTRDQLLDAAWGSDVALNDRVVDNHIVSLRRKLERDPSHPQHFLNIRGLGYRFDA